MDDHSYLAFVIWIGDYEQKNWFLINPCLLAALEKQFFWVDIKCRQKSLVIEDGISTTEILLLITSRCNIPTKRNDIFYCVPYSAKKGSKIGSPGPLVVGSEVCAFGVIQDIQLIVGNICRQTEVLWADLTLTDARH